MTKKKIVIYIGFGNAAIRPFFQNMKVDLLEQYFLLLESRLQFDRCQPKEVSHAL